MMSGTATSSTSKQVNRMKHYIRSFDIDMNFSFTLEYIRDIKYLLDICRFDETSSKDTGAATNTNEDELFKPAPCARGKRLLWLDEMR